MTEANQALHECRYALKFTYVYAFYLPEKSNFRDHFEMQQMELEKQVKPPKGARSDALPPVLAFPCGQASKRSLCPLCQTEDLAEQLERPVAEIERMKVVNSYQMAKKRYGHAHPHLVRTRLG